MAQRRDFPAGRLGPRDRPWFPPPAPPAPSASPAPASRPLASAGLGKPAWADVAPAGGLLLLSVGMHIAAMFPAYTGNPPVSVVSTGYEAAVYICLALGWVAAALLVLTRLSVRGGVALGAGIAAVELGFLIADLAGAVQASGGTTAGVWFAFAALGLGVAGVLFGASTVPMGGPRLRPYDQTLHPRAVTTVLVALLAVAAFLPSWDKYEVVNAAGRTTTVTLGNAFSQPAGIMAGELLAALAIGIIPILGALGPAGRRRLDDRRCADCSFVTAHFGRGPGQSAALGHDRRRASYRRTHLVVGHRCRCRRRYGWAGLVEWAG